MNSARSNSLLGVAVTLLLAASAPALASPASAAAGGSGAAAPVSIATVSRGDMSVRIPALGTVTPLATVTVKPRLSGELVEIGFTEGQLVRPGDFLAQIDPRPYQLAVSQAEGNLRRDQALLARSRLELKRLKEGGTPDLDLQKATVEQYLGAVEADEAAVAGAKLTLEHTRIVASVTGRTGLRQVDQGNYVSPTDASGIVVITQLQPITVILPLPEDIIGQIATPLAARASLPVIIYDRSDSTKLAEGKVLTLDNQIDTTTGTVKLRAIFDNADGALFPNQFVNVRLVVDTLHDQLLIPASAVHRGAVNGVPGSFVYLVDTKESTVSVRTVQLGVADGEHVSVTGGLSAGDVVVTGDGSSLRDGAKVLLPGTPTAQQGQHARG
jgi:multidrug efflux system membrane fusion protein